MKGLFITVEGVEGCGKSTQIRFLREYLESLGYQPVVTREPGGCPFSEALRGLLLSPEYAPAPMAELFLCLSARAQLVNEVLRPALEAGRVVICDRYCDSTVAYQGYGRGLGAELVKGLNRQATGGLMPDLTIYLQIPPEGSFTRKGGACQTDRMERENMAFFERVYRGFNQLASEEERFFVINTQNNTKFETAAALRGAVDAQLQKKPGLEKTAPQE